jgi:hypothetical protein
MVRRRSSSKSLPLEQAKSLIEVPARTGDDNSPVAAPESPGMARRYER